MPTESAPENALRDNPCKIPLLPAQTRLDWDESKNHGRYGAQDYTGCSTADVPIVEDLLKKGFCPDCAEDQTVSKLYPENPLVLVMNVN